MPIYEIPKNIIRCTHIPYSIYVRGTVCLDSRRINGEPHGKCNRDYYRKVLSADIGILSENDGNWVHANVIYCLGGNLCFFRLLQEGLGPVIAGFS